MEIQGTELLHTAGTKGAELQRLRQAAKAQTSEAVMQTAAYQASAAGSPLLARSEAVEDTVTFTEEDAIRAFLEQKKIEYKAAGDKTPGWMLIMGDLKVIRPEEFKAAVKNPFVIKIRGFGDNIHVQLKSLQHHAQNNPTSPEAKHWTNEARNEIGEKLLYLRDWSREHGTEADAEKFFSEYMKFAHNRDIKLHTLYDAYGIS